jgi:ankyrin repeat protein
MIEAALIADLAQVQALLAGGADASAVEQDGFYKGWTALMAASKQGHVEVVKALLARGADPKDAAQGGDNKGVTALMLASEQGHVEVVKALLAGGADPKYVAQDGLYNGCTALMLVSEQGIAEVAKLLLAGGADPAAENGDGKTALMLATAGGHDAVVEALRQAPAAASGGWAHRGNLAKVQALLAGGACCWGTRVHQDVD